MTSSKKPVLFIRLPDDVETKFQQLRTRIGTDRGKPITKNDLIVHLIEERFDTIKTASPSQQSSETEKVEAAERQTLASVLDTPPQETCTSEAHSA
jgi:hypothetical protein